MNYSVSDGIAARIQQLGGSMLCHYSVVIGSAAAYLMAPDTLRAPRDIDLSIPLDIYNRLHKMPYWHDKELIDRGGKHVLHDSQMDIGVGWGGMDHDFLQRRSWQHRKLNVASATSVFCWKQARNKPKDKKDIEVMRSRFNSIRLPPVMPVVTRYEQALIKTCLPARLRQPSILSKTLVLASYGLLASFCRNYNAQIQHEHMIIEKLLMFSSQGNSVLAPFTAGLRQLHAGLANSTLSDWEKLLATVAFTYSDLAFFGASAYNTGPAKLARSHAFSCGYDLQTSDRLGDIVDVVNLYTQNRKLPADPIARDMLIACL